MGETVSSTQCVLDGLIEAAADKAGDKVYEKIKPLLARAGSHQDDTVYDVETLACYLGVEPSWVYKQVSMKTIPYFKVGHYTRFRKRDIDKWIDVNTVKPIPQ